MRDQVVTVRVAARAGRAVAPARAWRRLAPGVRIRLDQAVDHPLPVLINGVVVGSAVVVTVHGRWALQIVTWGRSA